MFFSRPDVEVRRLWETCSSSREGREDRFARDVRRLDWMERILRFVRDERSYSL